MRILFLSGVARERPPTSRLLGLLLFNQAVQAPMHPKLQ
jgi:hypothetical protein